MESTQTCERPDHRKRLFCFVLDGKRYPTRDNAVTPPEIREIVGDIPDNIPIVLCLDDGTQRTLREDEETPLERCRHFKRLPRFKRG